MEFKLHKFLRSYYDIGYDSPGSLCIEVIIDNDNNLKGEVEECFRLYKYGKLTDHEFSHLLYGLSCTKYSSELNELYINMLDVGLSSENTTVKDQSIGLIENIGMDFYDVIELLKKVNMGNDWQEEYKEQVIKDINEYYK